MNKVRTRFAPSPTGFLHIGGLRTALYAYALAKHEHGTFILRVEDTDQKREVEGATDALQNTLKKFGLVWDEFYKQSDRQKEGIYRKSADKLIKEGHAFYCNCKPKNAKIEGFSNELRDPCRNKNLKDGAVKLKVPDNETLSYYDFIHKKEISWNSNVVYDATLLKSDGFPTYHLAVAVDDLDMKITHILRGHDWLPSTPVHLLVFKYLGNFIPQIGHATDILSSETGKKLSKRRDSVFAEQFLDEGYLSEALLNFIMLLGWAPKDNKELFNLEDFVKDFDIKGFQDANPRFFYDKLDWFNGYYIRQLSNESLNSEFKLKSSKFSEIPENKQFEITKLLKDRIKKLTDINTLGSFFFDMPKIDQSLFGPDYKKHLEVATKVVTGVTDWKLEILNTMLMGEINKNGFKVGDFFMTLRIALSGNKFTPPINDSIIIFGKEETLRRFEYSLSN